MLSWSTLRSTQLALKGAQRKGLDPLVVYLRSLVTRSSAMPIFQVTFTGKKNNKSKLPLYLVQFVEQLTVFLNVAQDAVEGKPGISLF